MLLQIVVLVRPWSDHDQIDLQLFFLVKKQNPEKFSDLRIQSWIFPNKEG